MREVGYVMFFMTDYRYAKNEYCKPCHTTMKFYSKRNEWNFYKERFIMGLL